MPIPTKTALALANLALFFGYVVPLLTAGSTPSYAHFWGNYGETPMRALVGMCKHPRRVLQGTLRVGAYPYRSAELAALLQLPSIRAMPSGLVAVRRRGLLLQAPRSRSAAPAASRVLR